MQKQSLYNLEKILFSMIGILLVVVMLFAFFSQNTIFHSSDHEEYYVIENVVYEQMKSDTAPLGIINEFRFTLEAFEHDKTLSFFFNHQNAEVYLGDECVYSLKADDGMIRTPGGVRAMIPLCKEEIGNGIRVVLTPIYKSYQNEIPEFWVGSELAAYQTELYRALPEMALSLCTIFTGMFLLCLALYHSTKRTSINRLYAVGLMTVSAGTWRFTYGNFVYMLFTKHTVFIYTLSVVSLMMVALCMLRSADLQGKWKKIFRLVSHGYCVVYILQFILQAMGVLDLRETLTITHVAIVISSVTLIVSSISSWRKAQAEGIRFFRRNYSWMIGVGAILDLLLYYFGKTSGMLLFLSSVLLCSLLEGIRALLVYTEQKKALAEMENQLMLSRTMTMMSQIRSHFVFNVLNAISGMCKYDPEKADDTVVCFARYLRNNINIMEDDKSIPFSVEIRQLEDYVMLEQIRFGDKIEFYTDIETDSFLIPPLILQPIVENAIKHGVSKKLTNGMIILRTQEKDGNIIITVEDDGVGFDMEELKKEQSVGIRNIRFRLEKLAGGTMDITSEVGVGTTVTITMPKREV